MYMIWSTKNKPFRDCSLWYRGCYAIGWAIEGCPGKGILDNPYIYIYIIYEHRILNEIYHSSIYKYVIIVLLSWCIHVCSIHDIKACVASRSCRCSSWAGHQNGIQPRARSREPPPQGA